MAAGMKIPRCRHFRCSFLTQMFSLCSDEEVDHAGEGVQSELWPPSETIMEKGLHAILESIERKGPPG